MSQIGKPPCDDAMILFGAKSSTCSGAARRWTLVAAVLGSSMAFIDGTVVNVALPRLQRELNATAFDAQWVIESYALFLASLLLAGGALGDTFGRRRIFMIGAGLFTAASLGCGLSVSISELIVARAVQGIGAAMLVPGSLSLISAAFPQSERGRAIGTWSAFSGITAAVGPVIGGFLVDHFAWTWAFLVNLPLGITLLLICLWKVPESRGTSSTSPVDFAGAMLATAGLAGIVFALIEAPRRGWSDAAVSGAGAAGVVAFILFVRVEARRRSPMLPLKLLRVRNFAGANLLTLLLYAALGGGLFFFPLNLIHVQGYGATAAGAALLPFILIMFTLSRWAGQLVDTFGSRIPLVVGPTIAAVGFALFAWPDIGGGYWATFLPAVCMLGLGMTVTVAPLTTTVMNSVGADMAGVASGVNNAVSRTAALLAIAAFGAVMNWAFDAALTRHLASVEAPAQVIASIEAQRQKLGGLVIPGGIDEATSAALRQAVKEAFITGFRWIMLLCSALGLLSALSAWLSIGDAGQTVRDQRSS